MSPRIQRLAIRLLRYQFTLSFVPGKCLQVPDALSRDPTDDIINTEYLDSKFKLFSVIAVKPETENKIKEAVHADPILIEIKNYVLHGWPKHQIQVSDGVKQYWPVRNDTHLHENLLFYQKRLILPASLRNEFLNLIHKYHQGVNACNKLDQDAIYYPGWSSDIEKMVLGCQLCQSYAKSNAREPLSPHDVPDRPWQKIAIDFKALGPQDFLVVVDYFSKFAVVNKLPNKTGNTVISCLKNIFAINGLPEEVFSYNGPPFNSWDFIEFANRYDIKLTTSSPRYPRSNGMVERTVQTVKSLLTKCLLEKEDPFAAILNYNVTAKQNLPSPSELLMGRRLRTALPVSCKLLEPKFPIRGIKDQLKLLQERQKAYYDVSKKKLSELEPQEDVYVQEGIRNWKPGVVMKKSGPNDYIVRIGEADYRRNRQQINPRRMSEETLKCDPEVKVGTTSSETNPVGTTSSETNPIVTSDYYTRSGRHVKIPDRLNL
ncbi:uncharacterized protein K02A2.6-like [Photinus pyralis]|uniref:uncharacterized protein K02A2.6-like n=1 Tax=Photinus pyralis TaxID=7054 RepID=UPI001267259A|nr:uncharacterized protein K02A2.6-like [Photinus pyralis]